jgi:molecular chaperone GrpE
MSGDEERPEGVLSAAEANSAAGTPAAGTPAPGTPAAEVEAQAAGDPGWLHSADPLGDVGPSEEAEADAAAAAATPETEAAIEADEAALDVEEDLEVASVARERDEYLDALRRLQADFENYKKRMIRQQTEHLERAAAKLVEKLLPVFDTADLAIAHGGGEEVKQVWTALFEALEREGLERIDPLNVAFDPRSHDAVAHEPGDGDGEPEVVEVMRAGYRWKGRVLRPAMVKVRG